MKILMVTNDFLPNSGGVANHIAELSKAIVRQGHSVTILHFCYEMPEKSEESFDGVKVIRKQLAQGLAGKTSRCAKVLRYVKSIVWGSHYINQLIRISSPDVVHWHDFYHSSLAMRRVSFSGKKILTNHASGYLEDYEKGYFSKFKLKFYAKPADKIIAPSGELAEKSKILNRPCCFIPNGVDINHFSPRVQCSLAWKEKLPLGAKVILAPRRLDPKNGLVYLIQAMPAILEKEPNSYLLIVGGGPDFLFEEYHAMASRLGVNEFSITGSIPYSQMPSLVQLARVVVIPSLMEAVSLAALEALAMEKPVVATRVGGLPYVIDDDVGVLVPSKNAAALTQAIIPFLESEVLCKQKGLQGRLRVESCFSWDEIARKTLREYE